MLRLTYPGGHAGAWLPRRPVHGSLLIPGFQVENLSGQALSVVVVMRVAVTPNRCLKFVQSVPGNM